MNADNRMLQIVTNCLEINGLDASKVGMLCNFSTRARVDQPGSLKSGHIFRGVIYIYQYFSNEHDGHLCLIDKVCLGHRTRRGIRSFVYLQQISARRIIDKVHAITPFTIRCHLEIVCGHAKPPWKGWCQRCVSVCVPDLRAHLKRSYRRL